jgi:putative hemolysin
VEVHQRPALFPELFAGQPDPIRQVLRAALHINALENLYDEARTLGVSPLSRSILETLQIRVQISERDLSYIPAQGPVIVVANHPYGLLDGMAVDQALSQRRSDIKILANEMVGMLEENRERCIPVDVFQNELCPEKNIRAIRKVVSWLKAGHGIMIFPAGEVSHWQPGTKRVTDGPWNHLAVRCAELTGARIVPLYVAGSNSLTFQMAGLLHPRLRTARLPAELLRKRTSEVKIRAGRPITAAELEKAGSEENGTAYVRARVYMLGQRKVTPIGPPSSIRPHHEVQLPFRSVRSPKRAPARLSAEDEIAYLQETGNCLIENATFAVYRAVGADIPALLQQVGRAREMAFREVGEGTGKDLDLDQFDRHYTQLLLWDKGKRKIAGGYRLAWTSDVLSQRGISGLYTSRLFRFDPQFFASIGPAVELGRSFVATEYQKEYSPLFLLWQAISRCVGSRPDSPVLFGPVSVSASYSEMARELIVNFLRERSFRADLAQFAKPRRAFNGRLMRKHDISRVTQCLASIEDLPIGDIEENSEIPILLRQYLRLGGRVAAFHVDAQFSYALDVLLIVDLREAPPKVLNRYMGEELSRAFLNR